MPDVAQPEINWDDVAGEAVDLLQRYIRIDTSNPPGNEELAADFLAGLLTAEGIESRKLISAPGRANLVADLEAEGDEKPLILLNHTDVVPVEAEHWSMDPFGGEIKDGYVWGRGALDMKGTGISQLATLISLHRAG